MAYTPEPIDLEVEKPTTSTGEVVHDADTIGGKRAAGYNAPEVTKVGQGSDVVEFAEPGAYIVRDQVADMLNKEGYMTLEEGEKDAYGRPLTKRKQEVSGKYLDEEAIARGIVQPGTHSDTLSNSRLDGAWSSFAWEQARNGAENVSTYELAEGISQAMVSGGDYFNRFVDYDMADATAREINKVSSNAYANSLHKKAEAIDLMLEQPNLTDAERQNLVAQRELIDQDLATAAIMVDNAPDVGIYNQSKGYKNSGAGVAGQLWESAELAGYNLLNRFYGFNAWAATGLENEGYRKWAEEGIEETEKGIAKNVDVPLLDLREIDSVGDAAQWAGNNLVLFGGDYAMMAGLPLAGVKAGALFGPGGAIIGGAIGTALSFGYTALISFGDVAGEFYEKDKKIDFGKTLAIGSGVLLMERIGIGKAPLKPGQVFTKDGAEKAIDSLIVENPTWTRAQAAKYFDTNLKKVVNDIIVDGTVDAADFLSKAQRSRHALKRLALRSGREAATEAAQEALQSLGVHGVPQDKEQREEFMWRLANSAAVGGLIGGTLNTPNIIGEQARVKHLEKSFLETTREDLSKKEKIEDDLRAEFKDEAILETQLAKLPDDEGDITELGTRHAEGNYLWQGIRDFGTRVIPLASAAANAVRNIRFQADGKANTDVAIYDNITGGLQTMGGGTHANTKQQRLGAITTYIDLNNIDDQLGTSSAKETAEVFDAILDQNSATIDLDAVPAHLRQAAENLLVMVGSIAENNSKTWSEAEPKAIREVLEQQQNDIRNLLKPQLPDLNEVKDRMEDAVNALAEAKPELSSRGVKAGQAVGKAKAQQVLTEIIEGKNMQDNIQFLKGLTNAEQFNEFYSKDHVKNMLDNHIYNITESTFNQYYGRNGSKVMALIQRSLKRGAITQEQAEIWAGEAIRQMEKEKSAFRRITNPTVRGIQNAALSINTIITLDLTAFAQVGEAVFAFNGVSKNEPAIKAIAKTVGIYGSELKDMMKAWGGLVPGVKYKPKFKKGRDYTKDLEDTPLHGSDVDWNTQAREFGYTPVQVLLRENPHLDSELWSHMTSKFFQLNGNQAITLATKASLLSFSWPTITKLLEREARYARGGKMTRARRSNMERLNYYGVDVAFMTELNNRFPGLDPADPVFNQFLQANPQIQAKFVADQKNAMVKMVNEMTATIVPGSRPTAIEDPRLAMFTQFTSFISHWHARVVPRLWQHYTAQGSPVMALHTFKIMTTAMLFAGLSQWMKDLLKYGDIHDPDNEHYDPSRSRLISSPYIESELSTLQRALDYTGVLGHGSSLGLDRFNKVYDFGKDANPITQPEEFQRQHDGSVFKWLFSELTDAIPAYGTAESIGRSAVNQDVEGLARKVPIFGDVKATREGGLGLLRELGVE